MKRVMAQGTFDILHPGHLHYLEESAALGDELYVVIARDARIRERKDLYMNETTRRDLVAALEVVDDAVLGAEGSIFESVEAIQPDVITLGYDQEYEVDSLESQLASEGFPDIEVVRIGPYEGGGLTSSSGIKNQLKETAGAGVFQSVVEAGDDES